MKKNTIFDICVANEMCPEIYEQVIGYWILGHNNVDRKKTEGQIAVSGSSSDVKKRYNMFNSCNLH